jgi:hypothetical protein
VQGQPHPAGVFVAVPHHTTAFWPLHESRMPRELVD